jgi:hypothetical protein
VHDFLTTRAYADAYVFGRTRTEKRVDASGKVTSTERVLPQDQWQVLITGDHPGYLDWDAYQDIQARLKANRKPPRGDGGGAARQGASPSCLQREPAMQSTDPLRRARTHTPSLVWCFPCSS